MTGLHLTKRRGASPHKRRISQFPTRTNKDERAHGPQIGALGPCSSRSRLDARSAVAGSGQQPMGGPAPSPPLTTSSAHYHCLALAAAASPLALAHGARERHRVPKPRETRERCIALLLVRLPTTPSVRVLFQKGPHFARHLICEKSAARPSSLPHVTPGRQRATDSRPSLRQHLLSSFAVQRLKAERALRARVSLGCAV